MPRVKALTTPHRIEIEVRTLIGAVMQIGKLNISDLAKLTGIDDATLGRRIGKSGDIGTMRLWEFIAIVKVAERFGVMKLLKEGWKP